MARMDELDRGEIEASRSQLSSRGHENKFHLEGTSPSMMLKNKQDTINNDHDLTIVRESTAELAASKFDISESDPDQSEIVVPMREPMTG